MHLRVALPLLILLAPLVPAQVASTQEAPGTFFDLRLVRIKSNNLADTLPRRVRSCSDRLSLARNSGWLELRASTWILGDSSGLCEAPDRRFVHRVRVDSGYLAGTPDGRTVLLEPGLHSPLQGAVATLRRLGRCCGGEVDTL